MIIHPFQKVLKFGYMLKRVHWSGYSTGRLMIYCSKSLIDRPTTIEKLTDNTKYSFHIIIQLTNMTWTVLKSWDLFVHSDWIWDCNNDQKQQYLKSIDASIIHQQIATKPWFLRNVERVVPSNNRSVKKCIYVWRNGRWLEIYNYYDVLLIWWKKKKSSGGIWKSKH